MLRLGELPIDPPLLLAPMAGVTDRDFRLILRRIGGIGLVAVEFVSSKAWLQGDREALRRLHFVEEERPIAVQIYGSDPETMAAAAAAVEEIGADVCDINMGCPANKILKGCSGAALMGDLPLARRIVAAVRRATTLPMTVKFRLGLDDRRRNFVELGRICEGEGAQGVTVHARTARQMFRGEAAWPEIARLVDAVEIPVIGNGDVREPPDALSLMRATGCAGVMIGRGATRDPWIFARTAARLAGDEVPEPTLDDRRLLILDHFRTLVDREPEDRALHKLRTFTGWYGLGLPEGQRLRRKIQGLRSPPDFFRAVEEHFASLEDEAAA